MLTPKMSLAYDLDHRHAIRKELAMDKVKQRILQRQNSIECVMETYPHPTGPYGIQPKRKVSIVRFLKCFIP